MALDSGEKTIINYATEGFHSNSRSFFCLSLLSSGNFEEVERLLKNHVPVDVHDEVDSFK